MIYYAVVAKNRYVLADYTKYDGEFPVLFQQIINTAPQTNKISTYTKLDHTYYLRHNTDGYAFGCLTNTQVPQEVAIKFLEFLQTKTYHYIEGKGEDSAPHATSNVLTKYIRKLIEDTEKQETKDRFEEINEDIGEVTDIVKKSIGKMTERGNKLEIMVEKSKHLNGIVIIHSYQLKT